MKSALLILSLAASGIATESPKPMHVEIRELPEAISKTTTSLNAKFIVATPADSAGAEPLPLLIFFVRRCSAGIGHREAARATAAQVF